MPLLLLLPLLVVCIVALVIALLPLSLWQRYRRGHSRRRAVGWAVGVNAWGAVVAMVLFAVSAAVSSVWVDGAFAHAAMGVAAGIGVGVAGLWLTHFEHDGLKVHYTPNRVLVLLLTVLVAGRIALGFWQVAHVGAPRGDVWWQQHASLFAFGGLLLGYATTYAWGVRWRVRRALAGAGRIAHPD